MPKGIPKTGINRGWIKKGSKLSSETRLKMKISHLGEKNHFFGKTHTLETCKAIGDANRGYHHTESARRRIGISHLGNKNVNWKGGITPINTKIRNSVEYKECVRTCLKRDDYTCQICLKRGGELHMDHVKSFSQYPELRFDASNLRTLCVPCHRKTSNYGGRALKKLYL